MTRIRILLLLVFVIFISGYATPPIDHLKDAFPKINPYSNNLGLFEEADVRHTLNKYPAVISLFTPLKAINPGYQRGTFRKIFTSQSVLGSTEKSLTHLEKSFLAKFDSDINTEEAFNTTDVPSILEEIANEYTPNFTNWSFIYLYVALIGR